VLSEKVACHVLRSTVYIGSVQSIKRAIQLARHGTTSTDPFVSCRMYSCSHSIDQVIGYAIFSIVLETFNDFFLILKTVVLRYLSYFTTLQFFITFAVLLGKIESVA